MWIRDRISQSRLKASVAVLNRVTTLLAGALAALGYFFVLVPEDALGPLVVIASMTGRAARVMVALVLLLPGLFYVISLYLYESLLLADVLNGDFRRRARAALFLLSWPAVAVALAYELPTRFAETIALAVLLLFVLLLLDPKAWLATGVVERSVFAVLRQTKHVMWDAWSTDAEVPLSEYLDVVRIRAIRDPAYAEKESLEAFQHSLCCAELEAPGCAELIVGRLRVAERRLALLDIGGGDGYFTTLLVQQVAALGYDVASIDVVDPVNWDREYRTMVGGVTDAEIQFTQRYYEEATLPRKYDVIVASHSLYSMCERPAGEPRQTARAVVQRTLQSLAPGGVFYASLASSLGESHRFKAAVCSATFGYPGDVTAETLAEAIAAIGPLGDQRFVSSLIVMEPLLRGWESGDETPIRRWLSYFLRLGSLHLSSGDLGHVVDLLESHCCLYGGLAEEEAQRHRVLHRHTFTPKTRVLRHLTVLTSVSPPSSGT